MELIQTSTHGRQLFKVKINQLHAYGDKTSILVVMSIKESLVSQGKGTITSVVLAALRLRIFLIMTIKCQ
jgi:hypothetical protein